MTPLGLVTPSHVLQPECEVAEDKDVLSKNVLTKQGDEDEGAEQ